MTDGSPSVEDIECALLWKLTRSHGWSAEVQVSHLARDANVSDKERAREVARNQLADRSFIGYHAGRDVIWIQGPPPEDLYYHLRDECGYTELQIEATFSSYFDGF